MEKKTGIKKFIFHGDKILRVRNFYGITTKSGRELGSQSLTIKAFILLKPGYSESANLIKEIQNHIKQETAPYKYPRQIECLNLEEWSKYETISGKIRRISLREREISKMEQQVKETQYVLG